MMVVALLIRPWVMEIKEMKVEAMILADDLLIFTHQGQMTEGSCTETLTSPGGKDRYTETLPKPGGTEKPNDHMNRAMEAFD